MKLNIINAILVLAIVSQLLAYLFTYLNKQCGVVQLDGLFYQLNAATHLLLWLGLLLSTIIESNKWTRHISVIGSVLAANQIYDEFYADPLKIQMNEMFTLLLVTCYFLYHYFESKPKPNESTPL